MRRILSWLASERVRGTRARCERGQMLIIFALIIVPVTFAVGAVAVDASVWQSERRGAQKDADLAALAGAYELILPSPSDQAARDAAVEYADFNDESGNAFDLSVLPGQNPDDANTVTVNDDCFPGNTELPFNSVTVNLDHKSRTFFAEAFGLSIAPNIGAHARACAGSMNNPEGLRPFAIDILTSDCFVQDPSDPDFEEPLFGQECTMDWGAQGTPAIPPAPRGIINLERNGGPCSVQGGGAADVLANIQFGANGGCFTNTSVDQCDAPLSDCTLDQSGNVSGPVSTGIQYLINEADDCDTDGDGRDEFEEALELFPDGGSAPPDPDNRYTLIPCSDGKYSERIITIVAVDELENTAMPIRYFIPVFIVGCRDYGPQDDLNEPLDPDCTSNSGHKRTQVIIFRAYLVEQSDIGAPNDSDTLLFGLDE